MPPAIRKVITNYLLLICLAQATQVGAATPSTHRPPNNGTTQTHQTADASSQAAGVDDILRDTLQLLDSLDQRLAVVTNHTGGGQLRSLESGAPLGKKSPSPSKPSGGWRDDAELTSLAEGFSSERHPSASGSSSATDLVGAAATNAHPVAVVRDPLETRHGRQLGADEQQLPVLGARAATGNQGGRFDNDFTERHIRFSLDLMRAVFAQHSYTAKSNTLGSFLISPVSLQLVLMMMHLGARGATKRELSHALHLLDSSPVMPAAAAAVSHQHLHHQQHNHLASEAGKPSVGATTANATSQQQHNQATNLKNTSSNNGKNAKLTRRHQQQQQQQNFSTAASSSRPSQAQQANQSNNNNNNNNNVNAAATPSQQSHQSQTQQREQLNNVHEQFGSALRQLLKDSTVAKALTSANQIFLQRDLPLAPHYEWAVRHYYGADLRQVDFQAEHESVAALSGGGGGGGGGGGPVPKIGNVTAAANSTQQGAGVQQLINEWVERQTRGKISNFLASPVPTSTLLMALNVLFFKGDWQYKFDPQDTDTDAWFTQTSLRTVKLPMMVNKLPLAHAHDPAMKTAIIELPYKAQRLGLFILLPDEIDGIFDTMQALNSSSFANLISMMRKSDNSPGGGGGGVNVRIPKFSIESSPRMSQILSQQLGLKTLFTPDQADLSGMFGGAAHKQLASGNSTDAEHHNPAGLRPHHQAPQVGLDELLHKAVLQVHEQGSVAAAASATIVERVGLFSGQYFEADHPFLLFLMDKQTGLVLFSGVFAGPPGPGGQEGAAAPASSAEHPARANSTAQVAPGSGGGGNNSGNPSTGRNPKQQQQPTASSSSG